MRTVVIILLLTLIYTGARAEQVQLNARDITEQMAEQIVKDWIPLPDINIGIQLPDQLDVGLKSSQYHFDHGGVIKFKNTDPDDITYSYQQGNHNLSIREDHIGYHFEKRFNWVK